MNLYNNWPGIDSPIKSFIFHLFHLINFLFEFGLYVIFVYVSLRSKYIYKILLLLFLLFCVSVEYGYITFYDRFSTASDVDIAIKATGEQRSEIIFGYLNFYILLILLGFIVAQIYLCKKNNFLGLKSFLLLIFLYFAHATFIYSAYKVFSLKNPSVNARNINENLFMPLPVGLNTVINSYFSYIIREKTVRIPLGYQSELKPKNNIIVVVDESLRGDHLSINGYNRPTTPFLEFLKSTNILQSFGNCASGSTASLASNNLLIVGENISENSDILKHSLTRPTLFQYAKAMNYKTYFFDPQKDDEWAGISDDMKYIDHRVATKGLILDSNIPGYDIDFKVAKAVNKIINTSTGNFIYIFKRGFHYNYKGNYPENAGKWSPIIAIDEKDSKDGNKLVNTYDNSLHYNIDPFFKLLLGDVSKSLLNTTILYTGDHGEAFLEDGKSAKHGGVSKLEATVPIILIGEKIKIDTNYKASHANILPTVLDMMKYPVSERKITYSISLLKATGKDNLIRKYVLPDLDHVKIIDFDK
ncbi:sulfatase-like hydrolase/transferase [Pedobacter changchengzhani]|uniref:sulfatase-like hydrolase/transferase n=1 Tax=Pedobacter changchengzhani TaxID=2529274 RepID=UPI0014048917|nr:sulfatase-like hydrolase/transferase [Pedobacter changchengzhani]